MTDIGKEKPRKVTNGRGRSAFRRRWWLAVSASAVMVVVVAWLALASTGPGPEFVDHSASTPAVVADLALLPGRQYSDSELALDAVIEDNLEHIALVDTRFRTSSDRQENRNERSDYFRDVATGHERERMHLERNLTLVFDQAWEDLPTDLGTGGLLDQAFEEAMDECARAAGWSSVQLYGVSNTDVERYQIEFGLSLDEFLDLRFRCAQEAATYPTLDSEIRDELLDRIREHYRTAAHEYFREFPDAEVPLVDHPGAPRPLEERLIKICLKTPDPAQCAAEFRVELPAG